jgi:hypothetical protein
MHLEAYNGFQKMLNMSLVPRMDLIYGLDVGGRNVNGSVRDQLPGVLWTGLDIVAGPDVNIVVDASSTTEWDIEPLYDIVIATELFEHTSVWRDIIKNMMYSLRFNGKQLFIATCASTGRQRHGASGEPLPPPGEWYQNVTKDELEDELSKWFTTYHVEYNPMPGDCYMYAKGLK